MARLDDPVGVLGARGLVGRHVLGRLAAAAIPAVACSRRVPAPEAVRGLQSWLPTERLGDRRTGTVPIRRWIALAPIWVVADQLDDIAARGAETLVALSSTSALTKAESSDPGERALAQRLREAEAALQAWGRATGTSVTLLRPTLIYGDGADQNITQIAAFIRRFGFFPVLDGGCGLRQPVHADDVAAAAIAALDARAGVYAIGGGEVLSYAEMVRRVAQAMGRKPRVVSVPRWLLRAALPAARQLAGRADWSIAIAERMRRDLVVDNRPAGRELRYTPRVFCPPCGGNDGASAARRGDPPHDTGPDGGEG